MRNSFANAFYEIAKDDPRIYLIAADIGAAAGVLTFIQEYPDRFLNVGVAEAIMIGMAAGMAMRGKIPFAYTIAPFTIYRPFEQVRDDCCYQDQPVRHIAVGRALNYPLLGATHNATEDIALMCALPNMTVLAPCDPAETREVTLATRQIDGPLYLGMGKAGEPDLTANAEPFRLGKIRKLRHGSDLAILTYGPIAKMALDVADRLQKEKGKSTAVYSVHCIKPLDKEGILGVLNGFPEVVVFEEHSPFGGLGPQVKELAWDAGISGKTRLKTYSLQDRFAHAYGSYYEVLAAHGLTPERMFEEWAKL